MGCMACLYFFRLATSVCRYNYGNSELNFAISGLRGLAIWRDRLAKIAELSRTVSSMKADRDAEVARLEAEVVRIQQSIAEFSALRKPDDKK